MSNTVERSWRRLVEKSQEGNKRGTGDRWPDAKEEKKKASPSAGWGKNGAGAFVGGTGVEKEPYKKSGGTGVD